LKRVIVATGDKVVMEPSLDEALISLFANSPTSPQTGGTQAPIAKTTMDQARAQLADAQKAIDTLKHLLSAPVQ
jgi:uncharacterized membrane protein (UPF0182 family)